MIYIVFSVNKNNTVITYDNEKTAYVITMHDFCRMRKTVPGYSTTIVNFVSHEFHQM